MNDKRLRQHSLGFWEVVDKPTNQDLSDYYANKYYQTEQSNYRRSYPENELEVIRMKIAQRLYKVGQLRKGNQKPGRVLDVGCGEGFALAEFQNRDWVIEGIDHSVEGLRAMNPDILQYVEQGNVFELLETRMRNSQKYDVIWLNNVLEHVIDPLDLLKALRRIIVDDGVLVVTVPNDFSELQESLLAAREIPERFWVALPDHLSYFTADTLKKTAKATEWHCQSVLADFPIDIYLAHSGSNYVVNRENGPHAHQARLMLEQLIGKKGEEQANHLYEALADLGLGRNITGFLLPA
jgi:2-polyprenyl-3-methyl-5-hydroxy-6-metoxy-1,4-benzoquinol methylase